MDISPRPIDPALGSGVPSSTSNSFYLSIATRGYQIQSRFLGIPDRWGYFSAGPPILQKSQAQHLVFVLGMMGFFQWPSGMILMWLIYLDGRPVVGLSLFYVAFSLTMVVALYVINLRDPKRNPDYDWEKGRLFRE